MTISPAPSMTGPIRLAKVGLANRSGDTRSTSTVPASTSCMISSHSSTFVELTVRARSPAPSAAFTWSRINASRGDTTRVGPPSSDLMAEVAAQ